MWSPRTTLAYCWRSRTLIVLGAWLAVSPWVLGTTGTAGVVFRSPVAVRRLVDPLKDFLHSGRAR